MTLVGVVSAMSSGDRSNKIVEWAIGFIVFLAPLVILIFTLTFLAYTGDLVRGRVTVLELLELYIFELVLFATFAYALYRLTLRLVERQLWRTPQRN